MDDCAGVAGAGGADHHGRRRPHFPYWLGADNQTRAALERANSISAASPADGMDFLDA